MNASEHRLAQDPYLSDTGTDKEDGPAPVDKKVGAYISRKEVVSLPYLRRSLQSAETFAVVHYENNIYRGHDRRVHVHRVPRSCALNVFGAVASGKPYRKQQQAVEVPSSSKV